MGDVGEDWRAHKEYLRGKRKDNLEREMPLIMSGWTKHTEHHYSGMIGDKRIDYWPSRNKFMFSGRVMTGGIDGFIKKHEKAVNKPTYDVEL